MAMSFVKKAAPTAAASTATKTETASKPSGTLGKMKSSTAGSADKKSATSNLTFLKKGTAAKEALAQAEAQAEIAKAEAGKLFRFYMKPDQERRVLFLEGELDADGMLDINLFNEHMVKINGEWNNFICTADNEPCPICAKGDSHPSLVGVCTVIDMTPHTIQNGPNAGKVIVNSRKLFVCKRETIKLLTKQAGKRDGLTGCVFDISRTGDKKPGVGDQFEFVKKFDSFEDILSELNLKAEDVQTADLASELTYRTADELVELGVGKAIGGIGHEKGVDTKSLKDEL